MEKIILKAAYRLENLEFYRSLKRLNKGVFIFIILAISFLSFHLNGNEEQYMLFAKQFMDPDWISSRYLNEFPGTRLLYQYIVGFFLQYFSFEYVLFFFRLTLCGLFAIPLAKIYRSLNISNVQILLHLPILFLCNQSLFGGSWMLISVEPKGFAYVFILFAAYNYIKGAFNKMIIYLILGSYFHVLVGAYAFTFFMICLFLFEDSKQRFYFLKLIGLYTICLLPFVIYLKSAVVNKVDYEPTVDWIYTYFRHPHHIGLFRDMSYFYSKHFYGILLSIIAVIFSIYHFKTNVEINIKRLNNFVLISLLGVLFFVLIAFFDTQGVLLKYYPFRINTLTTLILSLLVVRFFFSLFKKKQRAVVNQMIILISFLFLLQLAKPTLFGIYKYAFKDENKALNDMGDYIKQNTKKEEVVLSFLSDLSLNRRMERDRFVVYKFIPADLNEIPEWYERELFKRKLSNDLIHLKSKNDEYKMDYVLSKHKMRFKYLQLQYSNTEYFLYKINQYHDQ